MNLQEQLKKEQEKVKAISDKENLSDDERKELKGLIAKVDEIKDKITGVKIADDLKATQEAAEKKAFDEKVKAEVERIMAEKEPPVKNPGTDTGGTQVIKDEADQPFGTAGEYFQAVKNAAYYPSQQDVRLKSLSLKATGLSENVPADGGYLLQPSIAGGIIERMYDVGQLLSRVSNDPVGPNSNSMLYNAVDESSRVDGSRWGGVLGYWLAEAGTKTASKPTFRQMELKLKKVAALCYATDELLADSTALESWLTRTVPEELRFQVESAFYRGNGVGKPLGIMNSPCLVSVTRIDASQVDETDIANMWARRWQGVDDYVWLANASVFPQLINLTVGNFPFLLPISSGGQGDPAFSLYGKPYIESEYTYALGTTGDIMLASLSQYQTITKGGVQAASSIHVQFTTDETAFRFVYRTDGEPLWNSALTPYDGGNTKSPFVVLTAASV
jgi:HK97 family phage major capsid protein